MTRFIVTILFVTLFSSVSWGQRVTAADSLKIMAQVDKIFNAFAETEFSVFKQISTEKIYCSMCLSRPNPKDHSYMLDRKSFFDNYLKDIEKSDVFKRATRKIDAVLLADNNQWSDISVFFTVYQKDEQSAGHEGAQLGFYFKRENGEFKFSGIDTIP